MGGISPFRGAPYGTDPINENEVGRRRLEDEVARAQAEVAMATAPEVAAAPPAVMPPIASTIPFGQPGGTAIPFGDRTLDLGPNPFTRLHRFLTGGATPDEEVAGALPAPTASPDTGGVAVAPPSPAARFRGAGSLDYGRPLDEQIIGTPSFEVPPSKPTSTPGLAESKPGSIRALRLPNGKIIFTNRVDVGGGSDEKKNAESVRAAAGEIQAQDRASYGGRTGIQSQMTDLLRAAIDNRGGSMQPGGEANLDAVSPSYDSQSPGVSATQGSPEQQDELAMESGQRELGLTRLQQEMKAAKMSPEQAARLGIPIPRSRLATRS
jgi:hypothetical protein